MKRRKYGNKPCQLGAEKYSSERERDRHQELILLQRAGLIKNLRREVPFVLIKSQRRSDGKAERACTYLCDFLYATEQGIMVCEDTKGFRTKDYIIKRKLMLMVHGITVLEV